MIFIFILWSFYYRAIRLMKNNGILVHQLLGWTFCQSHSCRLIIQFPPNFCWKKPRNHQADCPVTESKKKSLIRGHVISDMLISFLRWPAPRWSATSTVTRTDRTWSAMCTPPSAAGPCTNSTTTTATGIVKDHWKFDPWSIWKGSQIHTVIIRFCDKSLIMTVLTFKYSSKSTAKCSDPNSVTISDYHCTLEPAYKVHVLSKINWPYKRAYLIM